MRSILLVVEPEDSVHQSASKALMLARYRHTRLDILFCSAEHFYSFHALQAQQANDQAHQYLDALRNSVMAPDIEITTGVALGGPVHEKVAQRVRELGSELVVKSIRTHHTAHDSHLDRQLIGDCPVPLLLTRGRPWHARARFASFIDIIDRQAPNLSRAVAQTGAGLGLAFGAELDLVCAQPDSAWPDAPEGDSPVLMRMQQLAREFAIDMRRLHILSGDAAAVLALFATDKDYDLIVLGVRVPASAHDSADELTARLLRSTGCDLIFVKPEGLGGEPTRPGLATRVTTPAL